MTQISNRTLFTGDNLPILRRMDSASVDLIYLDPPFNSNRTYSAPIGSEAAGAAFKDSWELSDTDLAWHGEIAEREPALHEIIGAAGKSHSKGMQAYLTMMGVRLLEMRRILRPTGSIYLHCDPTAGAYLKTLMDAILGPDNFRNEIVWCYTGPSGAKRDFPRKHDTILRYGRGGGIARSMLMRFDCHTQPHSRLLGVSMVRISVAARRSGTIRASCRLIGGRMAS